ncbi:MAG: DNRLRE domain-containing protein [Acidobacteria bacterium]|nr:DNRLRE domain-containing protein [Acidobacteriota bacterium]
MRNRLLISALAFAAGCSAVDLPVVADVHVGPSTPQAGALPNLLVGGGNRALLRFGMNVLPVGMNPAQVVKATLVFHVNRVVTAGQLQVAQLNGPFEEMTVSSGNAPPAFGFAFPVTPVQGPNLVDVTPIVQQWIAVPAAAYGFELSAASGSSASVMVDSKENTATSYGAEIRLVLSGPVGATGATGAQGLAGAAGAPGATGPTGPTGGTDPQILTAVCNLLSASTVTANVPCPAKTIFITNNLFNGNMGGLAGADALCQGEAAAAGLSGQYKAWLSTAQSSAAQRLGHWPGPYQLPNGTLVANNWADLTDGALSFPIQMAANGFNVGTPQTVWTGTDAPGASTGSDCGGWSVGTNAASGTVGLYIFNNRPGWTNQSSLVCNTSQRLYCVQQ